MEGARRAPRGWPGVSEPTPFPDSSYPSTVRCVDGGGGGQLRAWGVPPVAASLQPQRPHRPGAGSWRPASHGLPLPFPAETQDGGQQSGTSQRPEMTGQRVGVAGRPRTGQAGGPLSTLASCRRDPPGPVCPQERAAEGPEETDAEQRGSDTLTHMRVHAFAHPRSHMLTHTHTHTRRDTQTQAGACHWQMGSIPWAGRGWPAAPCCPTVASEEGEGPGRGHSGCSPPGHTPGVTWLPPQPGT